MKFDEESIGDGFMTDGQTPGSARWGLYVKNVKFHIWLVVPLRTVKFDEESIGDGFMNDG